MSLDSLSKAIGLSIALMATPLGAVDPARQPALVASAEEARSSNPIGRVARLFNPRLKEVEGRLDWLYNRLRGLATYTPRPLPDRFGWRAARPANSGAAPTLTLDLGDIYPLGEVHVIPAQPHPGETATLFPLRYRVEAMIEPDDPDPTLIYRTQNRLHESQDGYPRRLPARDIDARYLRLVIEQGHFRGAQNVAAISELVVTSGGEPISFAASVEATHCLDSDGRWEAPFAIDGRTPLGIWEGGRWTKSRGHAIDVAGQEPAMRWIVDLGEPEPIDRVVLFPYTIPELAGPGIMPPKIEITVSDDPDQPGAPLATVFAGETTVPLVTTLKGRSGRYLILHSDQPLRIGERALHGFSEIEAWSQGRNAALERPVRLLHAGHVVDPGPELTDGYANGLKIFPVGTWLNQLAERQEIEQEKSALAPVRSSLITESELNATWGAAVAIGFTLLIPVALVERRRLVSRKQIDKLRKRIASDLHDDIGSNLGSISLIARSAKRDLRRLEGPLEVAEDLDEVEVIARESSLAMRDIVWLLERQQDSIGDFVQRMRDTASRLLRDMDYTLTCRSNRTAAKMTLDAKRHLFLFYKEALHNILKHSKADEVEIRVYDSRDRLVMEVADNGIGLPVDPEGRQAAVRKLHDRALVLEGQLKIQSSPGAGTRLRLAVKRANLVVAKTAT